MTEYQVTHLTDELSVGAMQKALDMSGLAMRRHGASHAEINLATVVIHKDETLRRRPWNIVITATIQNFIG
jgi:hypothetical protein